MSELNSCPLCGVPAEKTSMVLHPKTARNEYGDSTYCYSCGTNVRNQVYCHGCGSKLNWSNIKENTDAMHEYEESEPLKPCACGGESYSRNEGVFCNNCYNYVSRFQKNEKQVADNWNEGKYDI